MYNMCFSMRWREVWGETTGGRGREGEESRVMVVGRLVGGMVAGKPGVRVPVLHGNLVVPGLHRALVVWGGTPGHGQEVGGAGAGGAVGVERRRRGSLGVFALVAEEAQSVLAVNLEVFPQRGGVGVGLVAASHPAGVRFVRGVDMHVLLPVARVGEPSITALNLALEWFLA